MTGSRSWTERYGAIDWKAGPDQDLALVRVRKGVIEEPVRGVAVQDLLAEPALVCFRMGDLAGAGGSFETLAGGRGIIDGARLAGIVRPTEESYDLERLAPRFKIEASWTDAAGRARAAAAVWRRLVAELARLPVGVLSEMEHLIEPVEHPLRELIVRAAKWAVKSGFGSKQRTFLDLLPGDAPSYRELKRPPRRDPPEPLDVEAVCGMFSRDGVLARRFAAYEYRPEQVRMAHEVCEAFNEGLVLMVEAGTGTGKSLAYLVPAIIWSVKNNEPVVVSTNTKNLQAQLVRNDVPFLEKAMGGSMRCALIKGRANYLCLRKLLMILRAADRELTDNERLDLLPVLSWLPRTMTGDVAENGGFRPGMRSDLWARISTRPDECLGPRCRMSRRCFVRKARAIALQADIIVANHATVFAETGIVGVALPEYRCIVFDEAHNLEDVATDCFTIEAVPWGVPRVLNRLFRRRRDGTGRGLLANLRFQLSRAAGAVSRDRVDSVTDRISTCIGSFGGVRTANDGLFGAIGVLFEGRTLRGDRIRYDAEHRPENWPAVAQAVTELIAALGSLAKQLERLQKDGDALAEGRQDQEPFASLIEVAAEVGSQAVAVRKAVEQLEVVLRAEDESYVYWAQRDARRGDTALCAAPLDVSELMHEAVYSRARTAVFTSATLSAAGSFDFMRDRLGMRGPVSERVRTTELGTSFDFSRQALLAVPTFLPAPRYGEPDFVGPFCELAVAALRATRGRGLVLFTSHAMLRAAHRRIKPALARSGIRVFTQGIDGERSRLMTAFAKETSSVLLGTQSFWEGVDVPGESLSCLILAKLPFRPHTDPIISARCQLLESHGRNPFGEYMVPDAAIRLKQGFGRLIRTRQDRGVVIVCDPRVVTRSYGRAFRESLPVEVRTFAEGGQLLAAIRQFFDPRGDGGEGAG